MTIPEAVNLALQRFQSGDLKQASDICRAILAQDPHQADTLQLLGLVHLQAGDARTAALAIGRAASLAPGRIDFHYNLGRALNELNQRAEAAVVFRRAASIPTQDAYVMISIAKELSMIGEFADTLAITQHVAAMHPNDAEVLAVHGQALTDMGQHEAALQAVRRSISLRPDDAGAHWNLAMLLLRQGDYAQGWREFEWRFKLANFQKLVRGFPQPMWKGEAAEGKTILLHAEGGFGDTFFYIRYLPRVRARVGRVIVECQKEIIPLVERMEGIERIVARGDALPAFDLQIPMVSLGGVFDRDVNAIQSQVPYLSAPAEQLKKWTARVPRDGKLNVGIAWMASRAGGDETRNLNLGDLAPFGSARNARFFSLQFENDAPQARPAGMDWPDYRKEMGGFPDTAALIMQLDLIISVDTSVAHLAGALGRPVWTLLPLVPSYFWLLGRSDTHWYPTMRLFRQTKLNDWSSPLAEAARKLNELARAHHGTA